MKLLCAIAMCSVAWAPITNFDTLITSCSDDSRTGRLQTLKKNLNLGETNIAGYESTLLSLWPKIERICNVIMEHPLYGEYARKLTQVPFLFGAINKIKNAEGPETALPEQQTTVKQLLDNIDSAIYVLPQIIEATEMLEKTLQQDEFKRAMRKNELAFRDITYAEFCEMIKILVMHKRLLLLMMKDLQDIRTPLSDLVTESTRCSTRQMYDLSGMTYRP